MKKKAFTLIELLIVVVVFSIVMASVLGVYISSQRAKYRIDRMTEAQQAARTALDFMIKDIRAAGYNIDLDEDATTTPQRRLVYAGPYELIFNANIRPVNDNPGNPIAPQAIDPGVLPIPFHYNPSKKFETGAETIVYTLDYNNTDGIINATDRGATESAFTHNPDDYALVKRVYGYDAATTSNGGTNQIVSIVGGPDQFPSQTSGTPLFTYWYDDDGDPSTPNKLYGDTDNDGALSTAEINASAITNQDSLDNIRIITVNITGVSRQQYRGEYYETNIQTDVSVTRNTSISVSFVSGHVYWDKNGNGNYDGAGEPGLQNFKVRLNTGELAITDANGLWSFALIPDRYAVSCSPIVGYSATTDLSFDFDIDDIDIDLTTDINMKKFFGFKTTPTATIAGFAFIDSNGSHLWDPDSTEVKLPDAIISTYNSSAITLDGNPTDSSYGTYNLTINADETTYVWVTPPMGYSAYGIDTILGGLYISDTADYCDILNFSSFGIYLDSGKTKYIAAALVKATGNPPHIEVIKPNGGEIYLIGKTNEINVKVYDYEDTLNIDKLMFFYSIDAGENWIHIEDITPSIPADSIFRYTWIPDTLINGSTICLVKVGVLDTDYWTVYDKSDDYFTLVDEGGFKSMFFTREKVDSISDETMFIISKGISPDSVLPYYCSINISDTMGIVADSFIKSGGNSSTTGTEFYTQNSEYAEYVTKKRYPYADTIYEGTWNFYLTGIVDDDTTNHKFYEIEVYKRDSLGSLPSETLLFSTMIPATYNSLLHSPLGNAEAVDTILVTTNAFSMDRSNRLYFKIFWSGSYSNTSDFGHIQFHFDSDARSIIILPPKS